MAIVLPILVFIIHASSGISEVPHCKMALWFISDASTPQGLKHQGHVGKVERVSGWIDGRMEG